MPRIMPAGPKSRSKKTVSPPASKTKNGGRAKSGCYTCRIRRKKCDERQIGQSDGPCATCTRLKLECLGFGVKRPDWLKDVNRVSEIRERIKAHLASQGMIKGHTGCGSRNPVYDQILELSITGTDYPMYTRERSTTSDSDSTGSSNGFGFGSPFSGGNPVTGGPPESDGPHPYHDGLVGQRHSSPSMSDDTVPYHLQSGLNPTACGDVPLLDPTLLLHLHPTHLDILAHCSEELLEQYVWHEPTVA